MASTPPGLVLSGTVKADFHSEEFFDWIGNLLLTCENVALNLNRMLHLFSIYCVKFSTLGKFY